MRAKDVMTPGVECVQPDDTIARAAARMRDLNVGALPICGPQDKLIGMITDRDITIRATAAGKSPEETFVRDVMTPGMICCFEDQDIVEVANLMEDKQVRRLAVLNENRRLVGILSLGDLAVRCADDQLSGEALERVSEPAVSGR